MKAWLFIIALWLTPILGNAYPGGETFKQAKKLYEAGDYYKAMSLYEQCIKENPEVYNSKGNYMIALCLKKLDRCSEAGRFFKRAWLAEPQAAGASSASKFDEQLQACALRREQLEQLEDNGEGIPLQPSANPVETATSKQADTQTQDTHSPGKSDNEFDYTLIFVLSAIAAIAMIVYVGFLQRKKQRLRRMEQAKYDQEANDMLFRISDVLFSDAHWSVLYDRFGQDKVEKQRNNWQHEYIQLSESKNLLGLQQLKAKIDDFKDNPEEYLTDNW
jgi:tetratricopeptide (TPR) repeat protein